MTRAVRRSPMRPVLALLAAGTALCASLALAASVLEFDRWMRAIDRNSVAVQKNLARRDGETAKVNAQQLEQLYAQMEDYFASDGHSPDAVQISRDGKEQAAAVLSAIDASDFDTATSAALRIARACNDCHDVYKPFK